MTFIAKWTAYYAATLRRTFIYGRGLYFGCLTDHHLNPNLTLCLYATGKRLHQYEGGESPDRTQLQTLL